ncbi:MAG: nitroreductase family protein [Bacteroidia bacterium]|nr:nitroreductase family protein [Bacteroidia bacterium]
MPDINEIIKNRRSHFPKEFTGDILDEAILTQCLKNAHWAPSHKLTFPWRFTVLSGTLVQEFYDLASRDYVDHSDVVNPKKIEKLAMMASKTSHIIGIICTISDIVPEWEEQASCAMAVQNMYLTLSQFEHAGGYWSTGLRANKQAMRELFNCNSNEIHMGNFIMGHIASKREIAARPNYEKHILRKG